MKQRIKLKLTGLAFSVMALGIGHTAHAAPLGIADEPLFLVTNVPPNLMLVLAGYRWDAVAPILHGQPVGQAMVDPVPQAMVLTAIVIAFGVTALFLVLAYRTFVAKRERDMAQQIAARRGDPVPSERLDEYAGRYRLSLPDQEAREFSFRRDGARLLLSSEERAMARARSGC